MLQILKAVAPYAAFMVAADGIVCMRQEMMPPLSTTTLDLASAMYVTQDVLSFDTFHAADPDAPSIYTVPTAWF